MMKSKLFIILSLAILLILSACGQGGTGAGAGAGGGGTATDTGAADTADGGDSATQDGMLHFTWHINYDWFSAFEFPNPQSAGELWIRDNKNVDITFMDPAGAAAQRLSTMIVDGEYPDVITIDRGQDLERLLAAGALVPLDDFIPGSNLERFLGNDLLNMFRSDDGHLYGFPNWAIGEGFANGNFGWMVNDYYYNALGRPPLVTFDDLFEYLVLVRDTFPGVLPMQIGEGMTGAHVIYGGMAERLNPGFFSTNLHDAGGRLASVLEDPFAVDTFVFINRLYRENLIPQDLFTMPSDQRREGIRNGLVAVLGMSNIFDMTGEMAALAQENPEMTFTTIPPLARAGVNPANIYTGTHNRMGWNINTISRDASDPEAIFNILDWMFGNEGQMTFVYGPPGDWWEMGEYTHEGFPVNMTDAFFNATGDELNARWSDANWVGNTSFIDGIAGHFDAMGADVGWVKRAQFAYVWPFSADATELSGLQPSFDSPVGIIYQDLDLLYRQIIPEIILAGSEEELREIVARYIEELYAHGLQQLLDYQTEIWLANRASLGR